MKKVWQGWIAAGMAFTSMAAAELPPLRESLLFHAGFEQGADADFARGEKTAQVSGNPESVEGVLGGKALLFSAKGDCLTFSALKNFAPESGTVALWVRDVDAKVSDRIWNPYFRLLGPEEGIYLTRMWQGIEQTGGLWRNGQKVAVACDLDGLTVRDQGVWHHLALVWRKHILTVYRDGKEAGNVPDVEFIFTHPGETFQVGRPVDSWTNADSFHSGSHMLKDAPERAAAMKIGEEPYGRIAIDEVTIFDRPLNADEIAVLAQQPIGEALDRTSPFAPGIVHTALINSRRKLRVLPSAETLPAPDATAVAVLRDAAGTVKNTVPISWGPQGAEYAVLDLADLPDGDYLVAVEFRDPAGKALAATPEASVKLTPPEVWVGNRIGADDAVLPGLFPMQADEESIRFWGREITGMKHSIFPAQLVNQSHPMLARPITWSWKAPGGEPAELTFDRVTLESATPTRAVYTASGKLGPLAVDGTLTAEYDGFLHYQLTFTPPAEGVETEFLKLEMPFEPAEATLFFLAEMRNARWPEAGAQYPITPIYRNSVATVGTPERCMQYLTESDQYFYPEDAPDALQLRTTPEEHLFEVAVIAAPFRLSAPFTLDFALEAGPVKPRPEHWRGWTYLADQRPYLDPALHQVVGHTYNWWARSPGEPIPADGFPAEPDKSVLPDEIPCASMHFGGFRETRSTDPVKRTPEWAKYEAEWERIPRRIQPQVTPGWNEQTIDTNASSWGDWHVWCVDNLFRSTGVRGLYYDDWMQGNSSNELAGSGYVGYSGTRRPTRDIWNQREFHRRVYATVKKYRPDDGLVTIHTSGCIYLPVVSFCDIIYDGEVMIWRDRIPPNGNYFDTYDPTILQMLLSAKMYGPVQGLHDMTRGQAATDIGTWQALLQGKQRQLWALLLANDIQLQGGFTQGGEVLRYLWLDFFGIAESDVKFLPYWDKDPAVKFLRAYWERKDGPEIDRTSTGYGSAYTRPGKALLILIRDADNNYWGPIECEYRIDRKRLGLPEDGPVRVTDLESFGRTPKGKLEGDRLTVPIQVDDFAALLLEAEKE